MFLEYDSLRAGPMIAGDSRFQYDDYSLLSSRSRLPWFTHLYITPGRITESLQLKYKPPGKISESLQSKYKPPEKISKSLQ